MKSTERMEQTERIERLYSHYREIAGESVAASVLVLAHVAQGDPSAVTLKAERSTAMLTLTQAAEVLGVMPFTLRKIVDRSRRKLTGDYVARPTIRFHQAGKGASILFHRKWLEDFIEGNAPEGNAPEGNAPESSQLTAGYTWARRDRHGFPLE
jgi:hypothetical protein